MAVISPYRMQSWRQARSQAGADSNELFLVPHMASAECAKHRAGFGYRVGGARYRGLSAFRVRWAAPITPGLLSIGVNAGSASHSPQNQSIPRAVRHEKKTVKCIGRQTSLCFPWSPYNLRAPSLWKGQHLLEVKSMLCHQPASGIVVIPLQGAGGLRQGAPNFIKGVAD